jgi:hypothetical protein
MATTTTVPTPDLTETTEKAREITLRWLEVYEKSVGEFADLGVKVAKQTKTDAIVDLAEAHAALTRELIGAGTGVTRALIA